jgi:hypothetical protein
LYYRGWSADEIAGLLQEPDLLDHYSDTLPPGRFYRVERVLAAEDRLSSFREIAERHPRLPPYCVGLLSKRKTPAIAERIAA